MESALLVVELLAVTMSEGLNHHQLMLIMKRMKKGRTSTIMKSVAG